MHGRRTSEWRKNWKHRNAFFALVSRSDERVFSYTCIQWAMGSKQLSTRSEYTHPCHNNCSFINLFLSIISDFQFIFCYSGSFFVLSVSSAVCSESKNYKIGTFHRTGDWYGCCCGQTTKATINNNTRSRGTRSTLSITLRQPENRFLSTRNRLHAVLFMRWKWHISRIAVPQRIGIRCRFFGAFVFYFFFFFRPLEWINRSRRPPRSNKVEQSDWKYLCFFLVYRKIGLFLAKWFVQP